MLQIFGHLNDTHRNKCRLLSKYVNEEITSAAQITVENSEKLREVINLFSRSQLNKGIDSIIFVGDHFTNEDLGILPDSLHKLDLIDCLAINDDCLVHLPRLKQLQELNISNCININDEDLVCLRNFQQLQHLNLSSCRNITDAVLIQLLVAPKLKYLVLIACPKITPAGYDAFRICCERANIELARSIMF